MTDRDSGTKNWVKVYELTCEDPYDDKMELRDDLPDDHRVVETADGVIVEVTTDDIGWREVAAASEDETAANDLLHSKYGEEPPYGEKHRVAVTRDGYKIERWEGEDD